MSPYSTRTTISIVAALTAVSLTIAAPARADAQVTTLTVGSAAVLSTEAHWTAASLANAKPMLLPKVSVNLSGAAQLSVPPGSPLSGPGRGPSLSALPDYDNVLFAPRVKASGAEPPSVMPEMFGATPGYRFTSSRITPDAVAALGAEAKYPNAINGQLFFKVPAGTTQPKGNYVCSATVQRPRIITTAGHCVSDGSGHFFKNWVFVPALRNGVGPFGRWKAAYVVVSNAWHLGGGGVPNAQDVASIELLDNATGHRIGDYTGYAGYQVPALYGGQHLTSNGYPCNIDSCNKMHRVDAEARLASNNTAIIGSDMRGGSSGGGWLINWGEYGAGEAPASGQESGLLRLIAVTSYGPIALDPLYVGASILDDRYVNGSNTGVLAGFNHVVVEERTPGGEIQPVLVLFLSETDSSHERQGELAGMPVPKTGPPQTEAERGEVESVSRRLAARVLVDQADSDALPPGLSRNDLVLQLERGLARQAEMDRQASTARVEGVASGRAGRGIADGPAPTGE